MRTAIRRGNGSNSRSVKVSAFHRWVSKRTTNQRGSNSILNEAYLGSSSLIRIVGASSTVRWGSHLSKVGIMQPVLL